MKRILVAFILLFVFCIPGLAQYTKFTPLLTPAKGSNLSPISINNANQILATYTNAVGQRKLIFAGTKGFTNINIPLDTSTGSLYPAGLNAAGDFYGAADRLIGGKHVTEGFIKCHTAGPLRYFKVPDATGTVITGINDKGVVVGYYVEPVEPGPDVPYWITSTAYGFRTVIQNSGIPPKIETIGDGSTYLTGINNFGDITGYVYEPNAPNDDSAAVFLFGFLLSKGQFYWVEANPGGPRIWNLIPRKMNSHGVMVGYASPNESPGLVYGHGFIMENGVVTFVDFPNVDSPNSEEGLLWLTINTTLLDINDSGTIIGGYEQISPWPPWDRRGGFVLTK
jgi:hypothetical protein